MTLHGSCQDCVSRIKRENGESIAEKRNSLENAARLSRRGIKTIQEESTLCSHTSQSSEVAAV